MIWDESSKPRDQAQELMWEAMEARTEKKAMELSRRALEIYPDCVDALAMLTDMKARFVKDYIEGMRNAVAAGRRDLGAKFFKENRGIFWGMIETRPFMRAMAGLVEGLLETDAPQNVDEAIDVMEEMLSLNPNDNQGMRDILLGAYLERKRYTDASKLLKKYEKDGMAVFCWGRVLLAFASGEEGEARELLAAAREQNKFVLDYLSGRKRRPRNRPEMYSWGSDEEAVLCAELLWRAWRAHTKARKWLKAVAGM